MREHLDDLKEIRSMMQKSTRFISLSGISGILIGVYALVGACVAYFYLDFHVSIRHLFAQVGLNNLNQDFIVFLISDAIIVLILSIVTSWILTKRNSSANGEKLFSPASLRLIVGMLIPLTVGGVFSLILLHYGLIGVVAPSMLIFYGLALINASNHTLTDIKYLGYLEILLGFIALLDMSRGLLYWALGFGLLHIIYGSYMYLKYEYRKDA